MFYSQTDGVVNGFAGSAIPDNSGLALVGDPDSSQVRA